jgi:hypothetical protein
MVVNVEEIKGFLEYTHKLGVLVEDDRVRLGAAGHAEMRNASTPTLARVSLVIGRSTNAATCVSVNALHGQLIVMR